MHPLVQPVSKTENMQTHTEKKMYVHNVAKKFYNC